MQFFHEIWLKNNKNMAGATINNLSIYSENHGERLQEKEQQTEKPSYLFYGLSGENMLLGLCVQ